MTDYDDHFEKPGNAAAAEWLDKTDLTELMESSNGPGPELGQPDTRTPMQIVNARLPVELVEGLTELAEQRGIRNRSDLIRTALEQYLARETGPVREDEAQRALDVLARLVHQRAA